MVGGRARFESILNKVKTYRIIWRETLGRIIHAGPAGREFPRSRIFLFTTTGRHVGRAAAHVNRCAARSLFTPSPHDHTPGRLAGEFSTRQDLPHRVIFFDQTNGRTRTAAPVRSYVLISCRRRVVYSVIAMHAYFSLCFPNLFPRQSPRARPWFSVGFCRRRAQ